MLAATALSISLDLTTLVTAHVPAMQPKPTCAIRVVSHKFVGAPGSKIKYAGQTFEIPASGVLELIAKKGAGSYRFNGVEQPLGESDVDEFGSNIVRLP